MLQPIDSKIINKSIETYNLYATKNVSEKIEQTYTLSKNILSFQQYTATGNVFTEMNKGTLFNILV